MIQIDGTSYHSIESASKILKLGRIIHVTDEKIKELEVPNATEIKLWNCKYLTRVVCKIAKYVEAKYCHDLNDVICNDKTVVYAPQSLKYNPS